MSRLPPFRIKNPLPVGTLVVWENDHALFEFPAGGVTRSLTPAANGEASPNGSWTQALDGSKTLSSSTSRWHHFFPRPATWVRCQDEYRPPECPDRFPLIEDNETSASYIKRVKADSSLEAVDGLSPEVLAAIYLNRKKATAARLEREAAQAKLHKERREIQLARQMFRR